MLDDFKLSRASKMPYYHQVYNYLVNKIKDQKLKQGYKLPNELELCRLFDVSRTTIRESLRELEANGYISRGRGQGTFILKTFPESTDLKKVSSIVDELKQKGVNTDPKVLEQKIIDPDQRLQSILKVDAETKVLFIKRLMIANNEPLYITDAFIPRDIIGIVEKKYLENLSFTKLTEDYLGLEIMHKKRILQPEVPDAHISEILQLDHHEKKVINYLRTFWIVNFKGQKRTIYFEEFFKSSKSRFIFES